MSQRREPPARNRARTVFFVGLVHGLATSSVDRTERGGVGIEAAVDDPPRRQRRRRLLLGENAEGLGEGLTGFSR